LEPEVLLHERFFGKRLLGDNSEAAVTVPA